jgi:predicted Zn-dependent protease
VEKLEITIMKIRKIYPILSLSIFLVWACQRTPMTNRKQFVGLVGSNDMMKMSFSQYDGFMDTVKVLTDNHEKSQMVTRVGVRIKKATEDWLIQNNMSKVIDGYKWEFRTVDSKELNAWCMPGGKVCFYTGILPICQTEEGIAVVMGHEVAHAIAEHGRERMSRAMLAQGFTTVGAIFAGIATGDQRVMETAGQVLGIGSQLGGVLPNSRKQEAESDKIGLILMAMAGYNPQEGPKFWTRMAEAGKNAQKPPLILSTHPSDASRIQNMEKNMDKAMKYYYAYAGRQ